MNHRLASSGILSLALMFASVAAFAAPQGKGPQGYQQGGEGRGQQVFKDLGLSEEQQQKLKTHREAHRALATETRKILKEKREALRAELEKPNFSENAAKKLNDEMKVAQNRMADQRLAGVLEVRKILTPEQYAKFVQLRQERMKNRGPKQGRGKSGRGPGGPGKESGPEGPGGPEE
jgi:protein CpxP